MITFVWLALTLFFLIPAMFHLVSSTHKIPHFRMKKRNIQGADIQVKVTGVDIEQPLQYFVHDFNYYIDYYNKASKIRNIIQATGYFLASGTSLAIFLYFLFG